MPDPDPPRPAAAPSGPGPAVFPEGFLWGAATSSYQIEGSPLADGAGPGIWHRFSHTPGNTHQGDTGDVACDHYRRWEEDVELMAGLGLGAYRFSLAWTRLQPEGRGRPNPAGLAFYDRLVDRLLERGIEPVATLYHWDHPAALDDRGGWLSPEMPRWFADYARIAFEALGDRVRTWATLNEPWVVMDAGYLHGVNAPGHRNRYEAPIATHHQMLAHAEAVRAYRAAGRGGRIGLVVNLEPKDPASDDAADVEAAADAHAYNNEYHLDAACFGRYPDRVRRRFGDAWPAACDAEAERIREPLDFVGVNYYTRRIVRRDPEAMLGFAPVDPPPGATVMETGWEVHPAGLTRTLEWVRDRYGPLPLLVTENGAAFADPPRAGGPVVDDPARVRYLEEHLRAVHTALGRGVDVRGYFAWSLLDNFEWSRGYALRFGLIHVDYRTQRRTPKASAGFYREVIRSRGAALAAPSSPRG